MDGNVDWKFINSIKLDNFLRMGRRQAGVLIKYWAHQGLLKSMQEGRKARVTYKVLDLDELNRQIQMARAGKLREPLNKFRTAWLKGAL